MPKLTPDHWSGLENMYFAGHPSASMLMDQNIWKGLRPSSSGDSQSVLAHGSDAEDGKLARIPNAERAVRSANLCPIWHGVNLRG